MIAILGKTSVVSARLAELLSLPPGSPLRPVEAAMVPISLVPADIAVNDLIVHGLRNRPELAEHRAVIEASLEFWRAAKVAPLVPELRLIYNGGGYGGGVNSRIDDFDWRGDAGAMACWRLDNLGFGNLAMVRERESKYNQAHFRVMAIENHVAAQIVAASSLVDARRREINSARAAFEAARESYRLNLDRIKRAPEQGRPIELLQAVQALQRAQADYLNVIADYNRAQFQLYTFLGNPPQCALDEAKNVPDASLPVTAP